MIDAIVEQGFQVIVFDNRDEGRSEKLHLRYVPPPLVAIPMLRTPLKHLVAPYALEHMAADAISILDRLGIDRAHIVGVSLGGMIGQVVAGAHPDRVSSFCAIMSTTGNMRLPRARLSVIRNLLLNSHFRFSAAYVGKQRKRMLKVIGTPGRNLDDGEILGVVRQSYERETRSLWSRRRQLAAIFRTGDLREKYTSRIVAPSLVLHGDQDPIVSVEHGNDIAQTIPNAEFKIMSGAGHDLAPDFMPTLSSYLIDHIERAEDQ